MTNVDADSRALETTSGSERYRPTGVDRDRYKNLKKWSYRRWAWEFLRRNPKFIEACENLQNMSEEEKSKVAQKFGLKRFKSYVEAYKGKSGYPLFLTDVIGSWTHLNSENYNKPRITARLATGEVLIRFDLNSALSDTQALETQIRLSRRRLEKRLAEYAARVGKIPQKHSHKPITFGIYLRLLDAKADGRSDLDRARMIHVNAPLDLDPTELRALVRDQIVKADEYAEIGYLYLALWHGKPNSKEIQLSR